MGSKGSGSNNQTVTMNLLPDFAQPHVIKYLDAMTILSNNAYAPYIGSTYAAQNANEVDGIKALADRGKNGSVLVVTGSASINDILSDLRFNTNTKIDESYTKQAEVFVREFEEETLPTINQIFNLANNYGSMSHAWAQAKASEKVMLKLQEIGMNMYFEDYMKERTFQISNLDNAIIYGEQPVNDADTLRSAGELQREFALGQLEDNYKKWHDEIIKVTKRLELLGNGLRTIVGAQHEETAPFYRPSPFAAIAGLALAGAGAYAAIKGAGNTNLLNKTYKAGDMAAPNRADTQMAPQNINSESQPYGTGGTKNFGTMIG